MRRPSGSKLACACRQHMPRTRIEPGFPCAPRVKAAVYDWRPHTPDAEKRGEAVSRRSAHRGAARAGQEVSLLRLELWMKRIKLRPVIFTTDRYVSSSVGRDFTTVALAIIVPTCNERLGYRERGLMTQLPTKSIELRIVGPWVKITRYDRVAPPP